MTDWSGHDGTETARRYRDMAELSLRAVSPSYERICLGVAGDPTMLARLDTLPTEKRQPNLLLGTVRYLGGPVDSYPSFRSFVVDGWDEVAATMAVRRTQTNEPRRCATLLPALAALPQPLALLEVGASAGLCLHPDRYAYRYDQRAVLGPSTLVLDCATTGPVPFPDALPLVTWRSGLDLNPLDVHDDDDVRWLEALIWPEETHRFDVLRSAVAIARAHSTRIQRGDLTTDLVAVASSAPTNATLVVFHSAVLAYLDSDGRDRFREQLAEIARLRPLVWLANEAPGVMAESPIPAPGDRFLLTRAGSPLAFTGGHGDTLDWLAQ